MVLGYLHQLAVEFLGLNLEKLTFLHMILRSMIVFILGIFIVKINKRFIGQRTEFNFVLFIMLGSILATSITGNAPFFAVLDMVVFLLLLNWVLAKLSFYYPSIEKVLKGKPNVLIENGDIKLFNMRQHSITLNDLLMQLRLRHGSNNIEEVESCYMETNGEISFLLKKKLNNHSKSNLLP